MLFRYKTLFITRFCMVLTTIWFFHSCNRVNQPDSINETLQMYDDSAKTVYRNNPEWILETSDTALKLINTYNLNDSLTVNWLTLKFTTLVSLDRRDAAMTMLSSEREKFIISGNDYLLTYTDLYLGENFLDDGKTKLAGKFIREGYHKAILSTSQYFIAWAHNLMGSLLRVEGDYKQSQFHLIKALELFENQNVLHAVGAVCNNIALNYEATGDSAKTLAYLLKSLHIAETSADTVNILASLNNLGIFYRTYKPDSAIFIFNQALNKTGNPAFLFQILSLKFNLGNYYLDRKEYKRAKQIFEEVLYTCLNYQILAGVARSYNALAMIYDAENNNEKALNYYLRAYRLADSIGETGDAVTFLDNLRYI